MEKTNPRLKKHIMEIVKNQLRDNDPPETKETLDRLISEGISKNDAMQLIASAVCYEIFHVLKSEKPSDNKRYINVLKNLPILPEE
jgi:Fe-S cluster assembly scaffold protein SufB